MKRRAMMSSTEDGTGEQPDLSGVGAQLRAARERLGWSLADVSAHLRIRYAHLVAVEEGRFNDLPGLTYAVGFVRSYAKLLGLDPDGMSRRLRAEVGADPKTDLEFPAPPAERGVPAGVVVLLGAVLAIGAYAAWYRQSADRPSPQPVQVVPDRLVAMTGAPPSHGAAKPPQSAAPEATSAAPDARSAAAEPAPQPAAPPLPSVPPTAAAAAVPPARGEQPSPGTPEKVAALASTNGTGEAAPAASPPQLALRASADAWVQVRDRKGQVLLNRILRAGETWPVPPQVPGEPPLLLTTGNAGGTELVVNGVVSPALGGSGAVRRDLPLAPALVQEGAAGSPRGQGGRAAMPVVLHPDTQ